MPEMSTTDMTTCRNLDGPMRFPGKMSSLSTPPTSFHSMSLLVGGANSSGMTRSDARRSWVRIVSLGISFWSSITNLRLFFALRPVPEEFPPQNCDLVHHNNMHLYTRRAAYSNSPIRSSTSSCNLKVNPSQTQLFYHLFFNEITTKMI